MAAVSTDIPFVARSSCDHCGLPLGRFPRAQEVCGERCWFCCYGCCLAFQVRRGERHEPEAAATLVRLGVGGFLAMNVMLFSLMMYAGAFDANADGDQAWLKTPVHWLTWILATPLVILLGRPFFEGAWAALRQWRLGTDTLVTIGVVAAYVYSAVQVLRGSDLVYFDTASMVLLLFTVGRYLEAQACARAARSVAPMLAAERAEVRVVRDGVDRIERVGSVRADDLVRVLPGERIASDGVVVDGESDCDEAILTGQSQSRAKRPGSAVHAGSVNGFGALLVRATVAGADTRWVHIGRLVREALAQKSMTGEFVDGVVMRFIPAVLLLACATAWFWATRTGVDAALLAGIAVLVVACPCSLGLAAPLAHTLAIGRAAQRGILLRNGAVLEKLARLRGVAFDKTGTLTRGRLRVTGVSAVAASRRDVLAHAAILARRSSHPVARAIAAHAQELPSQTSVERLVERPGAGVAADVDGVAFRLGSAAWMRAAGWDIPETLRASEPSGGTGAYVGWGGNVHGWIACADGPAHEARRVVEALRATGQTTLMLSGDRDRAVATLASVLGIDRWFAGLSPEDKAVVLRAQERAIGPLAMVGDGLNDGPVLAAASVGIAVGSATDLAKESADVVLPLDALHTLPWLLALAQRTRRSVRANLAWAFGYNAVGLSLAASGLLQPVFAAALMAGSSLLVVARSWRASQRDDVEVEFDVTSGTDAGMLTEGGQR